MLAQAGQHPHLDFVPSCLPRRLAARRAKRDHHPIGTQDQGGGGKISRQRFWRRQVALRQSVQVLLEGLHHVLTSRLHPPPHRLWTDRAPTVPAQQAGGGRKWYKDRQGTAQRLELPARPLMRLHSQGLIQGGHLRCLASVGAPSDPAAPLDWPKEAGDLALRKAFTVQARPTQRAAGPGRRVPGTFGQLGFDEVHGERAGHLPRRQD